MSINPRRSQHVRGVTLVEILVTISVGAIVMAALAAFSLYTGRGFVSLMNYTELEQQSRLALDGMARDIRQSNRLLNFTTNLLELEDYDFKTLRFAYTPSSRVLTRTKEGATTTLLKECDFLNFSIYQRNTTNGTYDQYPTSLSASNCKVVQVAWVCSRSILGSKVNTETVQSSKIVIRNQ